MKTARITDTGVRTAVAVAADPDVCAVQRDEDARMEREEIELLLEDVERELANEERTAERRVSRAFTDAQRARRAERRAARERLAGLGANTLIGGTQGQSKSAACLATCLDGADLAGEVAA